MSENDGKMMEKSSKGKSGDMINAPTCKRRLGHDRGDTDLILQNSGLYSDRTGSSSYHDVAASPN